MKIWIWFFLLTASAFAEPVKATSGRDLKSSHVVKVYSRVASTDFRGSGTLFQHEGVPYVLTSDHVVLHDTRVAQHKVINDKGELFKCSFEAADYGRGLALLRIQGAVDLNGIEDWQNWKIASPRVSDATVMMGFPHQTPAMVISTSGTIADPARPSSLLIQVPTMTLIENGHGEFGMSGGLATSASGEFLGVISHQIYSQIGRIQNDILLIPAAEAHRWLREYFSTDGQNIELAQTMYQQLFPTPLFTSGKVIFGFTARDEHGRAFHNLALASQKISNSVGGMAGALKPIEDLLERHEDCTFRVGDVRKKSDRSSLGVGSLSTLIRNLGRSDVELTGTVLCSEKGP